MIQLKRIPTRRRKNVAGNKERTECEVYSRVVGYLRPVGQWNKGKRQEFKDRITFKRSENE